jgi:hypothetical protein
MNSKALGLLEQFLRHRDLGQLEDGVAAIAHDPGAGLHEFFPQAGQRPLFDRQCVPKIRFCNIGGEGRREQVVM